MPAAGERPADRGHLARETFGFNGYFTRDCDAVYEIQAGHHWQPPQRSRSARPVRRAPPTPTPPVRTWTATPATTTSYNYGNTIPTAIGPAHHHADRRLQRRRRRHLAWSGCSPPGSRPASSTPRPRCPGWRRPARRSAARPGSTATPTTPITETPQRLAAGRSRAPTRASCC